MFMLSFNSSFLEFFRKAKCILKNFDLIETKLIKVSYRLFKYSYTTKIRQREITIVGSVQYHSRIARDPRTSAIIVNGI